MKDAARDCNRGVHCWHIIGYGNAAGPQSQWREYCCWCGTTRAVPAPPTAHHGPFYGNSVKRWDKKADPVEKA